jgi:tetraacyldisaccharide 4'-kinase
VWLCQQLTQNSELRTRNSEVAVLTRGYKAKGRETLGRPDGETVGQSDRRARVEGQDYSDEPAMMARACPGVRVVVNPDRVEGATTAIELGARVLILDDGFQHRRLARDLDVVAVDATLPFGYGRLLPAGLMREPLAALSRAGAVVITRSDQAEADPLDQVERTLMRINPRLVVARAIHAPVAVRLPKEGDLACADLAARRVYAFCGIGNPDAFFRTLAGLGARLVGTRAFDDHHACTPEDVEEICRQGVASKADLILTTEKNWLCLDPDLFASRLPAGYLEVRLETTAGKDPLIRLIRSVVESKIRPPEEEVRSKAGFRF